MVDKRKTQRFSRMSRHDTFNNRLRRKKSARRLRLKKQLENSRKAFTKRK